MSKAKKGYRVMWLARDAYSGSSYDLFSLKPKHEGVCWRGYVEDCFCAELWQRFLPCLKLDNGTCRKVHFRQLKTGMSIVWADTKILTE